MTESGTGNIGAYNSYSVTGSKWMGLMVMILDGVKGMIAVLVVGLLANQLGVSSAATPWLGLIGAVAGHNYNLWLSLKKGKLAGGKGLATVAGGLFLINPIIVAIWFIFFLIGLYLFSLWGGKKDSIPGNVLGTIAAPVAGYSLYSIFVGSMLGVLALIILPKHIRQIKELIEEGKIYRKSNNRNAISE